MGSSAKDRMDQQVQVANLYYKENMSQQEIANELKISRTTVSRILKSCIEEGIVSIHIKNSSMYQYDMEKKIEEKYGLKHVCVISNNEDHDLFFKTMGRSLADFLKENITKNVKIGISAGNAIESVSDYLYPVENYAIDVYQLMGDASHQTSSCSSYLTIRMARKLGGTAHAMHVPMVVNSKVLHDLLLDEPYNKNHFQELNQLDMAIVGLGHMDSLLPNATDMWNNYEEEKTELRMRGVVGNICGVFLNQDGNICDAEVQERIIAIPLDRLRSVPNCIAVAFGRYKKYITKAAIKGGYVNVLMIDEELALALLED